MPPKVPGKKAKKERTKKMGKGKIQTALTSLMEGEDNMKKAVNQAFKKLDANESGFLEKDELFEALNDILGAADDEKGIGKKQFDKFFANLDKDGDGKVSKEEFAKRARRLFKKMHEEPDADDDDDDD
ncbi:PREDICTED: calcineurin subunit B-like [Branchiostoma belcheri]|uniref:Calcineurin subunit B-like n=1 Tax=Branchiostoma belcheri TaxID=7741 RepID=A0A6P4YF59_BRABE|nr:PREDICTED: calcineurin subunit B-like [Branchiostoma belcheri]